MKRKGACETIVHITFTLEARICFSNVFSICSNNKCTNIIINFILIIDHTICILHACINDCCCKSINGYGTVKFSVCRSQEEVVCKH